MIPTTEFTEQERYDIVHNTIVRGAIGDALADSLVEDMYTVVPETMPARFTEGLATHLSAWLRNVQQRLDTRNTEYVWALIQALVMTGDLELRDEDGLRYYGLRRADIICPACREPHWEEDQIAGAKLEGTAYES